MQVIDWVIFGFIALSILVGISTGFDGQIRRLGRGVKGAIISAAIVFVFGAKILNIPVIHDLFEKLRNFFNDKNLGFISDGIIFDTVRYGVLYIITLIVVKVVFEILGSILNNEDGGGIGVVNKIFGGALAGAIGVVFVMLGVVVVLAINNQDAIDALKDSVSKIFLQYNPFIELFKLKY